MNTIDFEIRKLAEKCEKKKIAPRDLYFCDLWDAVQIRMEMDTDPFMMLIDAGVSGADIISAVFAAGDKSANAKTRIEVRMMAFYAPIVRGLVQLEIEYIRWNNARCGRGTEN